MVDEYYNKILKYSEEVENDCFIKENEIKIKEILKKIIDTNNDHMLTDSFLCYMSIDKLILFELDSMCTDDIYLKVAYLIHYYDFSIYHFRRHEENKCTYLRLLNEETRNAIIEACNYVEEINKLNNNRRFLIQMIYIVLSYCHINNRMNEFSKIYQDLFNKLDMIIEDMKLNNINDRVDFTVGTVILLENNDKKKIL